MTTTNMSHSPRILRSITPEPIADCRCKRMIEEKSAQQKARYRAKRLTPEGVDYLREKGRNQRLARDLRELINPELREARLAYHRAYFKAYKESGRLNVSPDQKREYNRRGNANRRAKAP